MDISDLNEHLLRLYLRLNGFFASGFIVHSPESKRNKTEVDTIAVRFPHNREPERQAKPDPWLDLSTRYVELAICEAKSKVRFNEALYSDQGTIQTILRWAGMFAESEVIDLAPKVQTILTPEPNPSPKIRRIGPYRGTVIRSLLFCPKFEQPRTNQSWFVGSGPALSFIFSCLSATFEPPSCGRCYGASQWAELAPLVKFFKNWRAKTPPTYKDFQKGMTNSGGP